LSRSYGTFYFNQFSISEKYDLPGIDNLKSIGGGQNKGKGFYISQLTITFTIL